MPEAPSIAALDGLPARLSEALRGLPGAEELYLFGSAAEPGRRDRYSDLDVLVISAQFELSRAAWPAVLSRVGDISLALQLDPEGPPGADVQEISYTLGFAGQSPYHKVDFGITGRGLVNGFFSQVQGKALLWRQAAPDGAVEDAPQTAWRPAWGSAEHFLLGELLSGVRYAKARKRGQHLTCWRFLSAKFNAWLRCYRWDRDPVRFPGQALTTWGFADLDGRLPEEERLGLLADVQVSSPRAMDRSLVNITRRIAARIDPGYAVEDTPPAAVTRELLDFIEGELAITG